MHKFYNLRFSGPRPDVAQSRRTNWFAALCYNSIFGFLARDHLLAARAS